MKILLVKPSSLGDVIHALPTLGALRRQYPAARISWLINAELRSLLARCPHLDQLIEFHRRQSRTWLPLLARLRRERFDLVLDLQGLCRSGLMTLATGAPSRIGLSDAREGASLAYNQTVPVQPMHAVDRYLRAARHLGCPTDPVEFALGLPPRPRRNAAPLIALNPSARWNTKLWGAANFAALADRLPPAQVVFTGSAAEADWIGQLARGRRNMAGKTDLYQLAELYQQCAVVVTNDSGPMHLAAAVGTPVAAIFGPTDPALTGPYGKQHIVLRATLPCAPCLQPRCRHTPAMECMSQVSVDQVHAAVQQILAA